MRFLYIFPHPDDESFGPAPSMHFYRRHGHEVYLLTLTKGGATKVRHELDLSVAEMGEVRYKEMLRVREVLNLSGMTVLDLPDSGLKYLDPREIEAPIREHIRQVQPNIIVTYPVHGISGFHDHLVTHMVVKRVFCELRSEGASYLKRLAFFTLAPEITRDKGGAVPVTASKAEEIGCRLETADEDVEAFHRALDCYTTYLKKIEASRVREVVSTTTVFELFDEEHTTPQTDLLQGLESA